MKKILIALFCLVSVAYAQYPSGSPYPSFGKWAKGYGYISSDSGFFSLYKDTTLKPLSGYWDIRWIDTVPYIWKNTRYSALSNSGGSSPISGLTTNYVVYATGASTIATGSRMLYNPTTGAITFGRVISVDTADTGTPYSSFRATGRLTSEIGSSGHAYGSYKYFDRPTFAFCAYDAVDTSASASAIDHFIAFQARQRHIGAGTLSQFIGFGSYPYVSAGNATDVWGYTSQPLISAGTTARLNHYQVQIPTLTGATVARQVGFYVPKLVGATANFGIYTEFIQNLMGGVNRFNGGYIVLNDSLTDNSANAVPLFIGNPSNGSYPWLGAYNWNPRSNTYAVNDIASKYEYNSTGWVWSDAASGSAGGTPTSRSAMTLTSGTRHNLLLNNGYYRTNDAAPGYFGNLTTGSFPELNYNGVLSTTLTRLVADEYYGMQLVNGFIFKVAATGSAGSTITPTTIANFFDAGRFRFGDGNTPAGIVDIKAGTATANTAPIKLNAGVNLTVPEAGAVEFDGTNYFVTTSTTRYTLAKTLTNTASLDFPSVIAGGTEVLTITVTGAADGDIATVGVPIASQTTGLIWQAYVSGVNTVSVSVTNTTVAPIEPATATFRVSIIKY